jgi:hypothetical protein
MPMSQYHLQWGALASLVYVIFHSMLPTPARADIPLTRADVDSFQNQVEIWFREGPTRPIRLNDWLSLGDAVRTKQGSQVDLRFNDGSLARVGELATFWFIPNTREFRLSNGTALLLIPPGNGSSTIETPNVVTGIQGTAVVVRYFPPDADRITQPPDIQGDFESAMGRTAVMVLTDSSSGPVEVRLRDGRAVDLSAGQVAIVDNGDLYLFEFDLALFYETSPLVEGLDLTDPASLNENLPTDSVRREILDGLITQEGFEGEFLLNPNFLSPEGDTTSDGGWLFPANAASSPPSGQPPATSEPPSSQPHDTSGTAVDLAPPEGGEASEQRLLTPGRDSSEDSPSVFPPGLINPAPDSLSPDPDVPTPRGPEDLPSGGDELPDGDTPPPGAGGSDNG